MQQDLEGLKVKHLMDANAIRSEVCKLQPRIRYICPLEVTTAALMSHSDASQGSYQNAYGETGVISRIRMIIDFHKKPYKRH